MVIIKAKESIRVQVKRGNKIDKELSLGRKRTQLPRDKPAI